MTREATMLIELLAYAETILKTRNRIYAKGIEYMDHDTDEWLSPKDVAKYLGISLGQVYWYLRQYPPPWTFYRVTATKRLTKKSDLDAWLEKVKTSPAMPGKS